MITTKGATTKLLSCEGRTNDTSRPTQNQGRVPKRSHYDQGL